MRHVLLFVASGFLVAVSPALAEDPRPGDAMLAAYFEGETAKLREAAGEVDWKAETGERRRQLAEMLGLDPMPERTPLNAVVTGTTEDGEVVIEKLHFQSRPGLYVTANFYRPKEKEGPLPAILYVCGHALVKKGEVSFGNKAGYHHHGLWFARNGYVCLTIDTLQLGEIEGIHHGTHRYDRWWWNSRGYTPAGVEAWNGIRALDYLQSRPEADGERIGMTGRSGGGAYTWFVAALDERVKAAVPVAGITDLENHVVDGCVEGHCDCMFFVNTYRWDYPMLAALVAPRPLLISNTDKDGIFPLDGVLRTHEYVRKVYELHDAEDKLGLHITEGPHKDTQELRVHAFVWFDRFLKGEPRVIDDPAEKSLEPEQLKVFATLPADEIDTKIDETFVAAAAEPAVPETGEQWSAMRDGWFAALRDKTFRGWADEDQVGRTFLLTEEAGGLALDTVSFSTGRCAVGDSGEAEADAFGGTLYVVRRAGLAKPKAVRLHVLGDAEWAEVAPVIGVGGNGKPTKFGKEPVSAAGRFAATLEGLRDSDEAVAFVVPCGVGPTAWTSDPKERTHIRRRFLLLGRTLDDIRVMDVRHAVQAIRDCEGYEEASVSLHGAGEAAGLALYASLFEPGIERVELVDLPASHRDGVELLNVLKTFDLPQAVALAAERCPVVLRTDRREAWGYPLAVADRLGWGAGRLEIEAAK